MVPWPGADAGEETEVRRGWSEVVAWLVAVQPAGASKERPGDEQREVEECRAPSSTTRNTGMQR